MMKHSLVAALVIMTADPQIGTAAEPSEISHQVELLKGGQLSSEGEDVGQQAAANTLVEIGSPAVPALTLALKTGNASYHCVIAETLARIGAPASPALPVILNALRRSSDSYLHCYPKAIAVLGPDNPKAIAAALSDRKVDVRRLVAAHAYTAAHDKSVLRALLKCLTDEDDIVRSNTVGALRRLPDMPGVIDALEKRLTDGSPGVRALTAEALGSFKGKARATLPSLRKLEEDGTTMVRTAAARAVKAIEASE